MHDLGDPWPDLSVQITDAAGASADATAVTLTLTAPDGTTPVNAVAVASSGLGVYSYSYTPTMAGRWTARWVATGTNASAFTDTLDVDEAAASGIVSLDEARSHLNMVSTTNDEELRRFIDSATDFIESRIGPVVRRTITEVITPEGGILWMRSPAISLTTVAAAYGYSGTYDVAAMYLNLPNATVHYLGGSSCFRYPVTVTYVAGRVVVPALIRQAALDYVAWKWESQRGPTPLPTPGGEYEVAAPATVPYKILQALEPYTQAVVA